MMMLGWKSRIAIRQQANAGEIIAQRDLMRSAPPAPENQPCPSMRTIIYSTRDSLFRRTGFLLAAIVIGTARWGAAADGPNFEREIRPILAEHCFACHGPDGGNRQAGLRLDRREGALAQLDSGNVAIRPGQPADSELIRRIDAADLDVVMPPPETKKPLTAEQRALLRRWIEAGAAYTEHWAYQRPQRPILPASVDAKWWRNEIDLFVLARLNAAGVAPSQKADRPTLIRRLSLDLLGLPPGIEDVDEFLADDKPDGYERLVDRLLASPHFGEKMAQDWLDLARFGDSSGYQDDGDRLHWPYRDYVINAFNSNQPFDQFTIENLAGDLLPSATLAQRVASGFNRLHRHNEEGGSDPDEFQVVYAVDRTNTTAATWMGITLGCAQCHDHKYDPITQREYYQLYAFFNSLKGEVPVSKTASPPQIRVPAATDARRLAQIEENLSTAERQRQEVDARAMAAFQSWLQAHDQSASTAHPSAGKAGAAGGVIARSRHTAWYADTRLEELLSLAHSITARGRVAMVRSVNNIVDVGHFSAQNIAGGGGIGMLAAEGPRYFATVVLPSGERLLSAPIAVEHGVMYSWSYRYDPLGGMDDAADADTVGEGLLTLQLQRDGVHSGSAAIDLTAEQRGAACVFDAFGLLFRGATDADSPLELIVDDVEYVIANSGSTRQQGFDSDPEWHGNGNLAHGHCFGFDTAATAAGTAGSFSLERLLTLSGESRPALHVARLRELFTIEKFPKLHDLDQRLAALSAEQQAVLDSAPLALVWEDMEQPRQTRVLVRGDYQVPGEAVERNVPAIFSPLAEGAPRDRLSLAKWLVSPEHPLTARVAVNRFWNQCFGAGLVRTPEDFGVRGEPPTHPELLDWLALEFIGQSPGGGSNEAGHSAAWDTKRMLRMIVTSAAYRQSSAVTPRLREIDPDNRLLARGARFRLSAEEIRDAALVAAGLLSRRIGGRSVYPYQPDHFYRDKEDDPGEWKWPLETDSELYRRGLYTFRRRTTPYPSYQTFDAPSRGECTVARSRTNTPLQALVTMNDPAFVEAARVLGERIASHGSDNDARLSFACRSVLSRTPSARERTVLDRLFQSSRESYLANREAAATVSQHGRASRQSSADPVEVAAWTMVANALLNLDEAITRQ